MASLFPLLTGDELQALAADIKANGLREPIVLDAEGRVLDGRNRLRACEVEGVEPAFTTYDGDPVAYVVSANLRRRNMTKSQLAIAAAEAWDLLPSGHGGAREQGATSSGLGDRRARLGAMFGVSGAYVQSARNLLEQAPDLAAAVKAGDMSLTEARGRAEAEPGKSTLQETVKNAVAADLESRMAAGDLPPGVTPDEVDDLLAAWDLLPQNEAEFEGDHAESAEETAARYREPSEVQPMRQFVLMLPQADGDRLAAEVLALQRAWGLDSFRDVVRNAIHAAATELDQPTGDDAGQKTDPRR